MKQLQTETDYLSQASEMLNRCKIIKAELVEKMAFLPKPTGNQRYKGFVLPEHDEWVALRNEYLENDKKIVHLRNIIGLSNGKKSRLDDHKKQECIRKIFKTNFTETQQKRINQYIDNADDSIDINLGVNTDEATKLRNSLLSNEIYNQLKVFKEIRKQFRIFMDAKEVSMGKSDFADLIKSISELNKSIPNESEISKLTVKISKL